MLLNPIILDHYHEKRHKLDDINELLICEIH